MSTAISTAASGLMAASAMLGASASNVANARTRGAVPSTPPTQPVSSGASSGQPGVYQALTTVRTALPGSQGVATSFAPRLPSYGLEYEPDAPFANAQGMVAAPNVDPVTEAVDQIEARRSFEANLATMRAAGEMERSLLDVVA